MRILIISIDIVSKWVEWDGHVMGADPDTEEDTGAEEVSRSIFNIRKYWMHIQPGTGEWPGHCPEATIARAPSAYTTAR